LLCLRGEARVDFKNLYFKLPRKDLHLDSPHMHEKNSELTSLLDHNDIGENLQSLLTVIV
jgi:hypothetical protein